MGMIDYLDAPFPYLIGLEPNPKLEWLELEGDVVRVELDTGTVILPDENKNNCESNLPELPRKEGKRLKERLYLATK
jgi:hypothetical protein